MPDISSIGHGSVEPLNRTSVFLAHQRAETTDTNRPDGHPGDRVELSSHSKFLAQLRLLREARSIQAEHIRQSIKEDTYEIEPKLDIAVDRLIEDLIR